MNIKNSGADPSASRDCVEACDGLSGAASGWRIVGMSGVARLRKWGMRMRGLSTNQSTRCGVDVRSSGGRDCGNRATKAGAGSAFGIQQSGNSLTSGPLRGMLNRLFSWCYGDMEALTFVLN